jgi:hypothetical protein
VRFAAADWTAIGSISTAIAAVIALVGALITLLVYRVQNRSSRAVATRELIRAVLRDSRQIVTLTRDSVTETAELQVREFRKRLGGSADVATIHKYFFEDDEAVLWSSFLGGYVASPAYSLLNHLWDEIDQSSTQLRGELGIFYYPAEIIIYNSQRAWHPLLSFGLAEGMRNDAQLKMFWQNITDPDTLTLTLAATLERKLVGGLESIVDRIEFMTCFVEDLWKEINKMSDRSLLRIAADRKFDWHCLTMVRANSPGSPASAPITSDPPRVQPVDKRSAPEVSKSMAAWNSIRATQESREKGDLAEIGKLLTGLEPVLPAAVSAELRKWVEQCRKTYDPGTPKEARSG